MFVSCNYTKKEFSQKAKNYVVKLISWNRKGKQMYIKFLAIVLLCAMKFFCRLY